MLTFTHGYNTFSLTGKHLTITTVKAGALTEAVVEQKTYALPDEIVGDMTHAFYDYISKITMIDIEPDDDVYTIDEFRGRCLSGAFIDSDGIGYYATDTQKSGYEARPSAFRHDDIDPRWTRVVWYNK